MKAALVVCRLKGVRVAGLASMPRWIGAGSPGAPLCGQGWGPPCPFSPCVPSLRWPHCHVPPLPPAWIREEAHCTSSGDDTDVDVEGLRRRRGREPSTPQPAGPVGVEHQARGEGLGGELGISLNMCLLGALVLLGLGVLLFSGECCLPAGV